TGSALRRRADAGRAPGRGVDLPRAFSLLLAREAVRRLGRAARRGRHLPRVDSASGRDEGRAALLRRRVRGGGGVVARSGLDRRDGRPPPPRGVAAPW